MRLSSKGNFIFLLGLAWGCASSPDNDPRSVAKDPVCLYNRDFTCVKVRVDPSTPRVVYLGETYYFCTANCAAAFQENPEKYLPTKK